MTILTYRSILSRENVVFTVLWVSPWYIHHPSMLLVTGYFSQASFSASDFASLSTLALHVTSLVNFQNLYFVRDSLLFQLFLLNECFLVIYTEWRFSLNCEWVFPCVLSRVITYVTIGVIHNFVWPGIVVTGSWQSDGIRPHSIVRASVGHFYCDTCFVQEPFRSFRTCLLGCMFKCSTLMTKFLGECRCYVILVKGKLQHLLIRFMKYCHKTLHYEFLPFILINFWGHDEIYRNYLEIKVVKKIGKIWNVTINSIWNEMSSYAASGIRTPQILCRLFEIFTELCNIYWIFRERSQIVNP